MRNKNGGEETKIQVQNFWNIIIVLMCTLIVLVLTACGSVEYKDDDSSVEKLMEDDNSTITDIPIMTREYVIEHGLLTEDELRGVDFQAMAEYYNLREGIEDEDIKESFPAFDNLRDVLLGFKDIWPLPGFGLYDDYWLSSIDEEREKKILEEDVDQINVIGLYDRSANYDTCVIIDIEKKEAYFWIHYIVTGDEPVVEILTDDQTKAVKNLIRTCGVYDWDQVYRGRVDDTIFDAYVDWSLYYVLEDGRVYSHRGSGDFDFAPNSYDELLRGLWVYYEEN